MPNNNLNVDAHRSIGKLDKLTIGVGRSTSSNVRIVQQEPSNSHILDRGISCAWAAKNGSKEGALPCNNNVSARRIAFILVGVAANLSRGSDAICLCGSDPSLSLRLGSRQIVKDRRW